METVIEGSWKRRPGARLHVAPEGMTLVDDGGGVVGTVTYEQVAGITAERLGRRWGLKLDLGAGGTWLVEGLHALQARFAAELVQDQLTALHRRKLAPYAQAQSVSQLGELTASMLSTSQRGVVDVLDFLLFQAAHHGASDVHFEPFPDHLRVRFRQDGMLVDAAKIPPLWAPRLFARLKVVSNLAIYRSDVAQEGRMALRLQDRTVDVRVSMLPTVHGEKAVLRLFDPKREIRGLHRLGMFPDTMAKWEQLLHRPQGMVLLTGPSNHGKTTTLYASLMRLEGNLSNLCTVEDPVEYDLRVINQTQVNNAVGLTFAAGLRTVLRQDPEVIMIGEIRDEETAGIAVRAGLTGHLILSTVHAPSAAGVFARLIDLGCEPFLVASSVSGVLSQRLVRRVCENCAQPDPKVGEYVSLLRHKFEQRGENAHWTSILDNPAEWRRGTGCEHCGGTGYRGRTGLFHLLEVTDDLRDGILAGKTTRELEQIGQADGGLWRDGLRHAAAGITTLEEIERVLGGPA